MRLQHFSDFGAQGMTGFTSLQSGDRFVGLVIDAVFKGGVGVAEGGNATMGAVERVRCPKRKLRCLHRPLHRRLAIFREGSRHAYPVQAAPAEWADVLVDRP